MAYKIGTYALALLARAHGIPFYVAAPRTMFDLTLGSGDLIPIEERPGAEIARSLEGGTAYNAAFDVTPADLVTGIITDGGVLSPPYAEPIKRLLVKGAGG